MDPFCSEFQIQIKLIPIWVFLPSKEKINVESKKKREGNSDSDLQNIWKNLILKTSNFFSPKTLKTGFLKYQNFINQNCCSYFQNTFFSLEINNPKFESFQIFFTIFSIKCIKFSSS